MNSLYSVGLRSLLDHARSSTAYYAACLPPTSEPLPEDVDTLLSRLPLLSRQDLRRLGVRLQARSGDTSTWYLLRSTGTTDEPAEVILDANARAAESAAIAAQADRCLKTQAWRERDLLHLVLHPGAASRALPSPWHPQGRVVKWNLLRAWQAGDACFLRALAHVHGQIITGLPSVAELLARRLLAMAPATPIRPLLMLLSGQALDSPVRSLIAEAFGCPVLTLYTLAEAGVVGAECLTDGGYHAEHSAVVEILNEVGHRVMPGEEGEIIVTPLANRAMVLLRYRTGDRGMWAPRACRCGRVEPRLLLTIGRRPSRLVTASGATVNVVRFAKVLANLNVERFSIQQTEDGNVCVYYAGRPLDLAALSLIEASVYAALGPATNVRVERVARPTEIPASCPPRTSIHRTAEPDGPDVADVARWLKTVLGNEMDLTAAVLTGSALDGEAVSRFSDLDLVLLFSREFSQEHWVQVIRRLRSHVPHLEVGLHKLSDLPCHAPLLTCRVLTEHLIVVGPPIATLLSWPTGADLRTEGRYWAKDAAVALWNRLAMSVPTADPVREAWQAAKHMLNALRFHYLIRGGRDTAARAIMAQARDDTGFCADWLTDFLAAWDVAREHQPPPAGPAATRYLSAALTCVLRLASEL